MKKLLLIGLCSLMTVVLPSCALFVAGGAAVGGLVLSDRRTTGTQTDDQAMELKIRSQADGYLQQSGRAGTVTPVSYNRNILLLGVVSNEEDRKVMERVARAQQSVRKVYNYITIGQMPTAQMVAGDTWITSKVRTSLLKPRGFSPSHVKVVTYQGVTYALGILSIEEQASATQQISTTSGVQKVVTLYETFTPVQ